MFGKVKIRVDKVFKGDGTAGRMWKTGDQKRLGSQGKEIQSRETIRGVPKRTNYGQAAAGDMEERMTLENLNRKDRTQALTGYPDEGGVSETPSLAWVTGWTVTPLVTMKEMVDKADVGERLTMEFCIYCLEVLVEHQIEMVQQALYNLRVKLSIEMKIMETAAYRPVQDMKEITQEQSHQCIVK